MFFGSKNEFCNVVFFLLRVCFFISFFCIFAAEILKDMEKEVKQKFDENLSVIGERVNQEVIQSYFLTTAHYDFTAYEQRIVSGLVALAQHQIKGHRFGHGGCVKIEPGLWGEQRFTFRTSYFLKDEKDQNYSQVKKALQSLRRKDITFEDRDDWTSIGIIESPHVSNRNGTVDFRVDNRVWAAILDFSKGYRKYELETLFSFKSIYSMRFYMLVSGQSNPLTYSLQKLKDMFRIDKKYTRVNDFIRFVLEPAKKDLDACSPYTFEYTPLKEGKKITGFTFFPIYQQGFRDPELEKKELQGKVSLSWELDKREIDYLKNTMNWSDISIRNNRDLLLQAKTNLPSFLDTLMELHGRSRLMTNPTGYVINALRGKLRDVEKGFVGKHTKK